MINQTQLPNYTMLSVSQRVYWHNCGRQYSHYFEYYTCEHADYGAMKEAVEDFINDKLETLTYDTSPMSNETRAFYWYAKENFEENLNLLMDIYLLDSMWHWGEHIESEPVEYYIMFKYGPY
ncbi:Protein CBG05334 [Caenorhabditis briggsae]|uniref:Uncharacterized protein n=3 Tax=Caenorhabditis briggsae TaxID=6238 RepID=A0AAE8ZU85_CAEBR|nr:Protein CBG05334 [Caenorhabditis briggsae]ULT84297.1 hypothetical protein L3Y34_013165 [Caenorhabditis briggsae]UMM43546.1 hypothetical protein L5515_019011 [Caenorhabditis briggsae]CAP25829.2 Protein CBG05334 [Caenorhabditis briggsae]